MVVIIRDGEQMGFRREHQIEGHHHAHIGQAQEYGLVRLRPLHTLPIRMIGFSVTPFSLSAAASLIWSKE